VLFSSSVRTHLAFFVAAAFLFVSCRSENYLVADGASNFKIFVSEQAPEPEKYAAKELQEYLQKISGVSLPIVHDTLQEKSLIYVGFLGAPNRLVQGDTALPNEHYVLRSDGNSLLIAGGGTRGTLYAVIGYLSDHLGCRWYTRDVHKIPVQSSIPLKVFDEFQKPGFELREAWYHEAYDPHWALHNRLNPSIKPIPDSLGGSFITYPFGHTFYNLVPPSQHFSKHPEYFALVDGKRQKEKAQLCLSNPGTRATAVETVFSWIKERPNVNVFSVDQNDYLGYCECDRCKAIDQREGGPTGSVIDFVNYVADTVASIYPDLKIQTFAYTYSEAPPTHLKPSPNVTIRLCRYNYCSAHGIDQCDHSKPFRDRYESWAKITDRISVWDYFTDFSQYLMPYPNLASVTRNVKWYADKGAIGLFAQGNKVPDNGGGEFSELRAWIFSQLMWAPDRDGDALVREFVENVYGAAAPHVQSYIDMMHADVKADTSHFSIWAQPVEVNYLKPELIARADSLFTLAAEAVSGDSALSSRVALAHLPILYTKLYFYSIGGSSYLTAADMPAVYDRFEAIRKKHRITAMGDMPQTYGNIEAFLEKVRTAPHYTTEWKIAGPFDNQDEKGLTHAFFPENTIDLQATYIGKGGKEIKWESYKNTLSAYIDFKKLFDPSDYTVAYAYHNSPSDSSRTAKFGIGSNDGVRVWVNHKLVLDHPGSRKAEPNQDIVSVPLNQGENHILVKVDQLERGWGFYFGELK
jgi:hypothetical protein